MCGNDWECWGELVDVWRGQERGRNKWCEIGRIGLALFVKKRPEKETYSNYTYTSHQRLFIQLALTSNVLSGSTELITPL